MTQLRSSEAERLAAALQDDTVFTRAELRGCQVPAGVAAVAAFLHSNKHITALDLGASIVDHAEQLAWALRVNSTLTQLTLKGSTMSEAGVSRLAIALAANKALEALDLSDCKIGDHGAEALTSALESNEKLHALDLSQNNISALGCARLGEVLRTNCSLSTLTLNGNHLVGDDTAQLVDALLVNTKLTELDLSNCNISCRTAVRLGDALKSNLALTALDLSRNHLPSPALAGLVEGLCANRGLASVRLSRVADGRDEAKRLTTGLSDVLSCNRSIASLELNDNGLEEPAAMILAKALKEGGRICALGLAGNRIPASGCAVLAQALATNTSLTRLDLSDNPHLGIAEGLALAVGHTLTHLELARCGIDDRVAVALARVLHANTCSLKVLNLGMNLISGPGAQAVFQALETNASLTHLDMSRNQLGASVAGPALAAMLRVNHTLTSLDVMQNRDLFRVCGQLLLDAVQANCGLGELKVLYCHLDFRTETQLMKLLWQRNACW